MPPPPVGGSRRKQTKQDIVEQLLANLRQRGSINTDDPAFVEGLRAHFDTLPSRCARQAWARPDGAPAGARALQGLPSPLISPAAAAGTPWT